MVRRSSRRSRRSSRRSSRRRCSKGGEGLMNRPMGMAGGEGGDKEMMRPMGMAGGALHPLNPAAADRSGPISHSQYFTINGGARKTQKKGKKSKKGGSVIATAAVPFGLFALQRYFQGKKHGTHKRSFRRRH